MNKKNYIHGIEIPPSSDTNMEKKQIPLTSPSSTSSLSKEQKEAIIHTLIKFGAIAAVITLPITGPTIMRVLESSDGYKLYEKYEIRGIDEPQAIEKPALIKTPTTQKEAIPTLENDKPIKVKVSDYTPTDTTKVEVKDYQPTQPSETNDALDMLNDISDWLNEKPVDKNPKNGGTTKVEVKNYQPTRPAIVARFGPNFTVKPKIA